MKKAVIYVRGHKEKMQEIFCRLYASDKGYKITYVTNNIDDVNLCDILLVANPSRISRDKFRYYEILDNLKAKGIKVESVSSQDNVEETLWLTNELMK
mgnify:CR=1 FL=1